MNGGRHQDTAIVVGGGIVGIACAHYLQAAGLSVTVIDQGQIGGACSHANCGYICPSHVPPLTEPGAVQLAIKSFFNPRSPFRVKPSLSPALWNWMWQFARRCHHGQVLSAGAALQKILDASMDEYRKLMSEHSFSCEWKEDGLLYVFRTSSGLEAFAKTDKMLTEHFGVTANRISGEALPDFDPGLRPGLAGAFHYPGDTSVRPDRLNAEWAEHLRSRDVRFLESCELKSIRKVHGSIDKLSTSCGDLAATHYIFATGALSTQWSNELQCRIPIQPGKGYSVTMDRPEHCPKYPMLFPEHKVGVSPFESSLRLGSMMEFVGYDTSIPPHRIQQLRDSARPYLVSSVDGEARETWYGWRPMTFDSLPIIGPVPNVSNAYLATGHNMLGLSLAPATGRLVAELVTGQTPHLSPSPYAPSRF